MISFHFICGSRRKIRMALHTPLHSLIASPVPSCRTFASKRKTKSSPDTRAKHKTEHNKAEGVKNHDHRIEKKKPRREELKRPGYLSKSTARGPKVLQQSGFLYDLRHRGEDDDQASSTKVSLASLDASALLDPLAYCKASAKVAHTHGVSQSISGTDAARRLLRGKKEFLTVARTMSSPGLLTGHGVPLELFQHCLDMADVFMQYNGQHIVECSFHNYNDNSNETKLPQILRIRGQDAQNRCSHWPIRGSIDWDYHMSLYVAVMERLVKNLGLVLQRKSEAIQSKKGDEESEEHCLDDDFTASPLLFPSSNHIPHWNVDMLRGSYFQFYNGDGEPNDMLSPTPIVEFSHTDSDSEALGHVLIRLQGKSQPNKEFNAERCGRRVTLVFDASFR